MAFPTKRGEGGFTLIELMVVLGILAVLVTLTAPRYFHRLDEAKLKTQQQQLQEMRKLIDEYRADKNAWPRDLETLVKAGYLQAVPIDPLTESNDTWVPVYAREGNTAGIRDIRSGFRPDAGE
ncbi:MAG: type II secretion system protein [Pseudomonadota bacterium]